MKATYRPKNLDKLSLKQRDYNGKELNVKPARPHNGVMRFWPDDIRFPGSGPIPITDLEIQGEIDIYCPKCSELTGICNPVYHLAPVCL